MPNLKNVRIRFVNIGYVYYVIIVVSTYLIFSIAIEGLQDTQILQRVEDFFCLKKLLTQNKINSPLNTVLAIIIN